MIATEWNDVYVEDDELIGMFPERFKGVEYDNRIVDDSIKVGDMVVYVSGTPQPHKATPLEVESYSHSIKLYCPNNPVEMDSELGLEVVKNETILSKYGINLDPKNGFHASLQRFFDKTGYLTDKQLNCFN